MQLSSTVFKNHCEEYELTMGCSGKTRILSYSMCVTFSLILYIVDPISAHFTGYNHMHPDVLDITLCPGDCYTETKQVDLEQPPSSVDIMFGMDETAGLL